MAANAIRGDELFRGYRTLFSDSPLPHTSHQLTNSTRSQSEERQRYEDRKWQLINERQASQPYDQFRAQRNEEEAWLQTAERKGIRLQPACVDFQQLALENVRDRWKEQGIWNDTWTNTASNGVWKHEYPLDPESESDVDTEAEANTLQFNVFGLRREPQPRPGRVKTDKEKRQIVERQSKRERDREASRPFYQFVYQVSTERERIQEESGGRVTAVAANTPPNINTMAYVRVRNAWIKRKIWNKNWGILPGMSWMHEVPLIVDLDDVADESALAKASPLDNGPYKADGAHISGPPPRHIPARQTEFEKSFISTKRGPAELNSLGSSITVLGSSVMDASRQKTPTDDDSPTPENDSAEHGLLESDSSLPIAQPRLDDAPLSPGPDVAKLPPSSYLRLSQRLRAPGSGLDNRLGGTATDARTGASRKRQLQTKPTDPKTAGSAKSQGVSKSQCSRTTRRKNNKRKRQVARLV